MEAMLALKREYAPALDIQLCAFAQEGILQAPGTETLLRRALEMAADLVAAAPTTTTDAVRHIEIVFALAREFGVDADFHVDFFDEPSTCTCVRSCVRPSAWAGRRAWRSATSPSWPRCTRRAGGG